jgi:hypothetical protein
VTGLWPFWYLPSHKRWFYPLGCSLLEVNRYFWEICRLHLLSNWFLAWVILRTWGWGYVLSKRRLNFNGLHSVIS